MSPSLTPVWLILIAFAGACGPPFDEPAGGGPDDGGFDAGPGDSGPGPADSGPADSGTPDAGVSDAGLPGAPAIYPFAQRHSPLTPSVMGNLKRIAGLGPRLAGVFAKVGDSNTVSTQFLTCLSGPNVELAARTSLQPTIDFFKPGPSFTRISQAATVGWSAWSAIAGSPSPLEAEVSALSPRYALVMFGTNDIGDGTGDVFVFARSLFSIADQLIAKGVIPLLTTLPPRDDAAAGEARVPEFDGVVHGLAQARQVPLMASAARCGCSLPMASGRTACT